MKVIKLKKTNIFLLYYFILLYLEIVFKILTNSFSLNISLLYIIINAFILAFLLTGINTFFKDKINKVLFLISIFLFSFLVAMEYCVYKIFGFYFDLSLLGATDQVISFAGDGIKLILENVLGIMIIFFPFIILLSFHKKIAINQKEKLSCVINVGLSIIFFLIFVLSLNIKKNEEYSAKILYSDVNNIELTIKKMGVIHGFFIDLKRNILGFEEKVTIEINEPDDSDSGEYDNGEPSITYKYNNLDIDFDSLINSTNNETLKQMHEYFKNESGTLQNEYTGMFEGKNLILFMAESFNEIAVDENRTPTLYKLIHEGFDFKNFYTPTISSTIGGEFQELTGLVAASGFLSPWKSGTNSYPMGIANVFKDKGYATFAYHDHNYTFQSRNKYLQALGFTNFKGCRNGLETLMNCKQWPESDVEMINVTVDDYLNSESPFFTYYVTVSGHGDYNWSSTAMGRKHKNEVIDLPYSEKVLAYLAAQIELDQALKALIEKLDEKGILDDTVIALVGDHYPYYLSTAEVNEVASYKKDSVVEINHSNFILWNNAMECIEVEKVGSQIDVLPTIYNLFNIPYDSRLFAGKDILSTEPGLAIFGNLSWVSDYGTYFSSSGKFVPKDNKEIPENYVKITNKKASNRMNISKLIMVNDYYKYIK